MADIDALDVRILECVSERFYTHRNEVHGWLVKELPSVAMLQRRLERLEEKGYLTYEFGKGYLRTTLGTGRLKAYYESQTFPGQ